MDDEVFTVKDVESLLTSLRRIADALEKIEQQINVYTERR